MANIRYRKVTLGMNLLLILNLVGIRPTIAADYDRLLSRIPGDANALVLLNVEAIFSSPKAKAENWKQSYADNFAASPLIVPPNSKRFAQGAEIEIETMEPMWEVASMELSVDPSVADVAQHIGGVTDTISGVDAVWPHENLCIAKFAPTEFGVLSPATRQSAARWARRAERQEFAKLAPYLQQAAEYAENSGPEIIMAIDLDQIVRPDAVRLAVQRADFLRPLNLDDVTRILVSLRGVTLGVRVSDRIYGKLLVEFGEDASLLKPIAQQLVLSVLSATGAMLDEFNDWQGKVEGKRVSIEGPLTTEGMRRLFSVMTLDSAVINRPGAPHATKNQSPTAPPTNPPTKIDDKPTDEEVQRELVATASYRYFRSIERYLNDLDRPRRSKDLSDIALWINNFARKIERLPAHNVDPDLQTYGQNVVYGMRDAVGYLHGIDERTADRQAQVRPKSDVTVGALPTARVINYGGYYRVREYVPFAKANVDIASALEEQDRIATEEYEAGTDSARQVMEHLKSETNNIRQVMTQRYGREF